MTVAYVIHLLRGTTSISAVLMSGEELKCLNEQYICLSHTATDLGGSKMFDFF